MKIYIAGKITGDPYYKAKFARAAADIADAGHTPISPAMQPEGMSNADYMRVSFAQLDSADAVAFLPDWEDSKGARIETSWWSTPASRRMTSSLRAITGGRLRRHARAKSAASSTGAGILTA